MDLASKLQFIDDILKKGEFPNQDDLRQAIEEYIKQMPNWIYSLPNDDIQRVAIAGLILNEESFYGQAVQYYYNIEYNAYQEQKRGGVSSWDLGHGPQIEIAQRNLKIRIKMYLEDMDFPEKITDFIKERLDKI